MLQVMLAKVGKQVLEGLLDLKDKRDKKDRGCLEWSTSAGGAQTAVEMLRLCTQVKSIMRQYKYRWNSMSTTEIEWHEEITIQLRTQFTSYLHNKELAA